MSPRDLLKTHGINVVLGFDGDVRYQKLGSPLQRASLVRDRQTSEVLVVARQWELAATHDILHEGIHAICGPASLRDEGGLMYVQWVMMRELLPKPLQAMRSYLLRRYAFVNDDSKPIVFDGRLVGWTGRRTRDLDEAMKHPHYYEAALEQGLVSAAGALSLFGPHPDWASYQVPTPWEGPPDPWDSSTW